uniref:Uncharacterized protein n=1 Tax=Arundo donax TaxID=35708 RepID=A0A0A8ZCW9_ARUDO
MMISCYVAKFAISKIKRTDATMWLNLPSQRLKEQMLHIMVLAFYVSFLAQ